MNTAAEAARTLARTLALVEPVLGPARENGGGAWGLPEYCFPCPLHGNGTGNGLILSVHRDIAEWPHWWCRKCRVHWSVLLAGLAEAGVPPEALPFGANVEASSTTPTPPSRPVCVRETKPLPDDDVIEVWAEILTERPDELRYLLRERLWRAADVERFEIGWHPQRKRYVFPQRDEAGELVNVRLWAPHAPKGKRWQHWPGHGKRARAWPLKPLRIAPPNSRVYLCAGEPDAMAAIARGLVAVTGPGGEGRPLKPEDIELLAGHRVVVVYDSDAAGRDGARSVVAALREFGGCRSVRSRDLFPHNPAEPPAGTPKDLTDWLRRNTREAR